MTAVVAGPWVAAEIDPEQMLVNFRRWFPGIMMWFGEFTGHYWAMTRRGLVEGADAAEFGRRLAAAQQRRAPLRYASAEIIASRFARGPQTGAAGRPISVPHSKNGRSRPAAPPISQHGRHERPPGLVRRLLSSLRRPRRAVR